MRRRPLLRTVGAAVGLGSLASTVSADDGLPVRREIRSLRRHDPDDIVRTWREGIEKLRSLDADDPRNWDNQVRIHGNLKRFINCEHGNWLFLAWHRAYLHYHEEIIRELTGNESFALPYWNWIDNLELPAIFHRDPFTNPSRTPNSSVDRSIAGREQVTPALDDPNFLRAIGGWAGTEDRENYVRAGAGAFESPAHDYVHIRVGGHMATGLSPNDPSFWAHHSTMDRLWWEWNARGHPNVADDRWLDWKFEDHFVDRDGNVIEAVTVRDALGLPEREYTYDRRIDGGTADVDPSTQTNTADVRLETPYREVFGEDVTLGVGEDLSGTVDRSAVEPYITGKGRVLVAARNIAMPENGWFHGRVYVDPPSKDPGPGSRHYAGTYHLWIAPPAHPPQNQYVDITETLGELHENDELGDTIEVLVAGDRMRSKGDSRPSTPVETFSLEVTRSHIDGEVVEY